MRGKRKINNLGDKCGIKRKGLTTVIEELKQRLLSKAAKIKRYGDRITQYRQNQMFATEQKKVYKELNGVSSGENVIPDAEESKKLWSEKAGA